MLFGAVLLVGGWVALTLFTRKADPGEKTGSVLDADQFALLEQISEAMIPTTDTPGAIAAGVPQLMLDLLTNWGNDESRAQIVSVLSAIEQRAWKSQGAAFLELPAEKRFEVVSEFDAEGVRQHDVAYRKFKQLVAGISGASEGLEQLPDGQFLQPMELNCAELAFKKSLEEQHPTRRVTIGRCATPACRQSRDAASVAHRLMGHATRAHPVRGGVASRQLSP